MNRPSAACSRYGIAVLGAALLACAPHYDAGDAVRGDAACVRVEEFLATSFPRPVHMRGRATFDVESYRVRGHFDLTSLANGDAVLEFSGSTLLGGGREDAVVSIAGDTLRVLDRERGHLYEGDDVARMIASGTGATGEWLRGMRRVLAAGCAGAGTVRASQTGLSGSAPDGPFELRAEGGRLVAATWPNPAPEETFRDRLEVHYRWRNGDLELLEARLPVRGWRIRLEAE